MKEYFLFFSNLWCSSKLSTRIFNHVFTIDHVYGGINLLKYFYVLVTSLKTHLKIYHLNFKILFKKKLKLIY
jgi:hypothetical protein